MNYFCSSFTIQALIRINQRVQYARLLEFKDGTVVVGLDNWRGIGCPFFQVNLQIIPETTVPNNSTVLNAGEWIYLTAVYSSNNGIVYLNRTISFNETYVKNESFPITENRIAYPAKLDIASLKIFNKALSFSEILEEMN